MKSLDFSRQHGLSRYVAHQAYYSLVGREYEWELMPLGVDQGVSAVVWSPLGWGRLTGKIRRGQPLPAGSRLNSKQVTDAGPQVPDDYLYTVVDALDAVAEEAGKTVPQVALNWLLQRPDGRQRHRRRPQRGTAAAEPRRGRLEPDARPGGQARRGQRRPADLPLLAPGRLRRAEPVPDRDHAQGRVTSAETTAGRGGMMATWTPTPS